MDELESFPEYREATRLAKKIAKRDGESAEFVLEAALTVAVALRVVREHGYLTPHFLYEEMDYTHPAEVRDVLRTRLKRPEEYATYPMVDLVEACAPIIAGMSESEMAEMAAQVDRRYRGDA